MKPVSLTSHPFLKGIREHSQVISPFMHKILQGQKQISGKYTKLQSHKIETKMNSDYQSLYFIFEVWDVCLPNSLIMYTSSQKGLSNTYRHTELSINTSHSTFVS